MKKKTLAFLLCLGIAAIGGFAAYQYNLPETQLLIKLYGPGEASKLDPSKPLKEQKRLVQIGGRTFDVPIMYIDGALDKGLVQDGMNLKYVLPDYKSIKELGSKEEYLKEFHAGNTAHMLIVPQSSMPPIEVSADNILKFYAKSEHVGPVNGLDKYLGYKQREGKLIVYDEFYLEKDNSGKVVGFLICSPDNRVPKPGCNHHFLSENIRYDIHYNKANFLNSWLQQKTVAIKFIDSFEVQPATTDGN